MYVCSKCGEKYEAVEGTYCNLCKADSIIEDPEHGNADDGIPEFFISDVPDKIWIAYGFGLLVLFAVLFYLVVANVYISSGQRIGLKIMLVGLGVVVSHLPMATLSTARGAVVMIGGVAAWGLYDRLGHSGDEVGTFFGMGIGVAVATIPLIVQSECREWYAKPKKLTLTQRQKYQLFLPVSVLMGAAIFFGN